MIQTLAIVTALLVLLMMAFFARKWLFSENKEDNRPNAADDLIAKYASESGIPGSERESAVSIQWSLVGSTYYARWGQLRLRLYSLEGPQVDEGCIGTRQANMEIFTCRGWVELARAPLGPGSSFKNPSEAFDHLKKVAETIVPGMNV